MEQRFGRKERRQGGKRLEGEGERRAKVGGGRKVVERGNKTPPPPSLLPFSLYYREFCVTCLTIR